MEVTGNKEPGWAKMKLRGHSGGVSEHARQEATHNFRLELDSATLEELRSAAGAGHPATVDFGASPGLRIGSMTKKVQISAMSSTTLLYEEDKSSPTDLYLISSITHTILMKESSEQLTSVDAAKAKLQGRVDAEQRRRADSAGQKSSPAPLIRKPPPSVIKPRSASHLAPKPQLSKPPTSQPNIDALKSLGASDSEEKRVRHVTTSARYPFIHFLAVKPRTRVEISQEVKVPEDVGNELIRKYAKEARRDATRLELIDLCYKSLDIWDFPYASEEDRKSAQENGRQAFDRMRISASETKIWDSLLPVEDRGKGICLSKSVANNPKPAETLGIASGHRKMLAGAGGESASRSKPKGTSNLMRIAQGKKPLKQSSTPSVSQTSSPKIGAKMGKSPEGQSKKANGKEYKSAELISEEDDMDVDESSGLIIEEPKAPQPPVKNAAKATLKDSSSAPSKKRKAIDSDDEHEDDKPQALAKKADGIAKRIQKANGEHKPEKRKAVDSNDEDVEPRPPQRKGDGIAKRVKTVNGEPKPASAVATSQVKPAATEKKENGIPTESKKDSAKGPSDAASRDRDLTSGDGSKERLTTAATGSDGKTAKRKRTESLASNESKPSARPSPKLNPNSDAVKAAGQSKIPSGLPAEGKPKPKPVTTAASTKPVSKPTPWSMPSVSKLSAKPSPAIKPSPLPKISTPSGGPSNPSSDKATSRPSTSDSSSKSSPEPLIEKYKALQPTHRTHLRTSLYLHLTLSLLPPDLRSEPDTTRFETARVSLHQTEACLKTLLTRMTPSELTTIKSPYTTVEIKDLAAKDKKYLAGRGLEPWILLPEGHKAIVDEVVGFREFAAKRLQVLRGVYKKERGRLDGLFKGGEEWMALRDWLCESILVVRQVGGLLS